MFALKILAGRTDSSKWSASSCEPRLRALKVIHSLHASRSFTKGSRLCPRVSLLKMLRKSAHYGAAIGSLACYEPGNVSLPSDRDVFCILPEQLDSERAHDLLNFESCMLRPPDELCAIYDNLESFANCYPDPTFDDPWTWANFVFELYGAGVICFGVRPRVVGGVSL